MRKGKPLMEGEYITIEEKCQPDRRLKRKALVNIYACSIYRITLFAVQQQDGEEEKCGRAGCSRQQDGEEEKRKILRVV